MIKLFQFASAFNLPNPSPFCMKAEILLKMAGTAYATVVVGDPRKGPKGKLPAIEDEGALIGDSELIRWHLERKYGIDFDRGLDARARAAAHAFARMLEERTYWVGVYNRWIDPRHWPAVRSAFFDGMPPVIRSLVPLLAQRKVRGYLRAQGIGRHTEDEIYALGVADIRAIAAWLADRPCFMGAEPSAVDATVYPFMAGVIVPPFASPLRTEALEHANLVAYVERMRQRYFG